MYVSLLIASLAIVAAAASDASRKPTQELAQSRLRGSSSKAGKQLQSKSNVEPVLPSMAKSAITGDTGERFGADGESCSSEGVTPGVCALASIALSEASVASWLQSEIVKRAVRDGAARDKLERALVAEIESALGENHTGFDASRLRRIEQKLLPIFATLPQQQGSATGSEGGIGYAAARYLLHQHFVRQHSWHVRGLSPGGPNSSTSSKSLRTHVAGHLLQVMEDKVGQQGFSLKMLAIFVATLEHLFQGDQHESLKQVWSLYGLQAEAVTDAQQVSKVIEAFIAHHVYVVDGFNFDGPDQGFVPSIEVAANEVQDLREAYSGWPKILSFLKHEVEKRAKSRPRKKLNFQDALLIADRVLEYFREVSGSMCHDMEQQIGNFSDLSGVEKGKARLADLRRLEAAGENIVEESLEYLREVGALDGGTEQDAYVIVPNYMLCASNCDLQTSFYDVCCPNSCELHREHLERELLSAKSDDSTVIAVITEIVQLRLGSPLPVDMIKPLDAMVTSHGGAIAIHSRDFADWLHMVFPRDCPRTHSVDWKGERADMFPVANAELSISV